MSALTREQTDHFWEKGYVIAEDAVTPEQLEALQAELISEL